MTAGSEFLASAIRRLKYYKDLCEKTFIQLQENDFHYQPDPGSNSIAIIIRHLSGNMLSRWTNFLQEDGEKAWRNRDEEFETPVLNKEQLLLLWEKGWDCFLGSLSSLTEADLLKTVYIRAEPLSVTDAINRQLAHYPYHAGQIVYLGRMCRKNEWKSLSIEKGLSQQYNETTALKDPAKKY